MCLIIRLPIPHSIVFASVMGIINEYKVFIMLFDSKTQGPRYIIVDAAVHNTLSDSLLLAISHGYRDIY